MNGARTNSPPPIRAMLAGSGTEPTIPDILTCRRLSNPTVEFIVTLEMTSPPDVVIVKKFCPFFKWVWLLCSHA
jgi:hypothetical protein